MYTYSRSGTPAAKPGLCLSSKNAVALSHTPERACNAAAGVTSRTFETTGRSRQKLQQKITAGTGQDRESDTSRLPISQSHRSRAGPGSGGHRFDLEHELHVTDRKLLHMIAAPLDDTRVCVALTKFPSAHLATAKARRGFVRCRRLRQQSCFSAL